MKFSVVIPTYNRQSDLTICLESILSQNILPTEVVLIDDGELPSDFIAQVKNNFSTKGIELTYHKKDHALHGKGLSESKNLALNLIQNEIICYLDDDLALEPNFFASLVNIWQNNPDPKLIGVGGVIVNNRQKNILEKFYNQIFCLGSKLSWDINPVAYQIWDDHVVSTARGYYSHGGVSSYRRTEVMKLHGFKTFSGGRTSLEDVDFSLRAKKAGYYFMVTPGAKTRHKNSTGFENNFQAGKKESINRKEIFRIECVRDFYHEVWFVWASMGWILRQFLTAHFSKGFGMINGFIVKQ